MWDLHPRPRCVVSACFAVALGLAAEMARAAPPVQVSPPVALDRLGFIGGPFSVAAAGNGQGLFAVVWHGAPFPPLPVGYRALQARVYDAFGPPRTTTISVTDQASDSSQVGLTMDDSGGFLVAWIQAFDPGTGLGMLVARRYRVDGTPATSEVVVAAGVRSDSLYHNFAVDLADDGTFLAVFQRPAVPGPGMSLVVRAFQASGQPAGSETVVSTAPEGTYANAVFARSSGGAVVVVYAKPIGVASSAVWARRLDGSGAPRSPEFDLVIPPVPGFALLPSGVVLFPDGRFVAGYQQCDPFVMDFHCGAIGMRWMGADGSPVAGLGVKALFDHAGSQSVVRADAQGNVFGFTQSFGTGDFVAANPLGAVVSRQSFAAGLPPPSSSLSVPQSVSLVPFGPAQLGVVWSLEDWVYLQTLSVGGENTPAPSFYTVEPCRLVDTRGGGQAMTAGEDRSIAASGRCAIPAGARALAANVVSVGSTAAGDLRFYRPDRLAPPTTSLNYGAGQVRANSAIIPLDDKGALAVRATQASGTTHLIVDVSGYFE